MDGDLRYISLQYIKGDNYDEITCFKYERMKKLLGYSSEEEDDDNDTKINELEKTLKNSPKELFDNLNDAKEKVNCKIGESFLNDLVNYYNFKDILELLTKAKKITQDIINELNNDDENDEGIDKIIIKLKKSIDKLNGISNMQKIQKRMSFFKRNTKEMRDDVIELLGKLKDGVDESTDEDDDIKGAEEKKELVAKLKEKAQVIIETYEKDNDNGESQKKTSFFMRSKSATEEEKTKEKEKHDKFKEYIKVNITDSSLEKLYNLIMNKIKKTGDKKVSLDNLMRLYNTYIKYCKINMEKYEKLFKYNEISNIDEAFMIESYSKFLKKLRVLKENLESKDTGKTKRLLVNSFNKLFNKYGIDPNKSLSDDDIAYITNMILQ